MRGGTPKAWDRETNRRTLMRAGGALAIGTGVFSVLAGSAAAAAPATPAASPVAIRTGADWPTFHGDAGRTGMATDPGPAGEPELLWRFESGLTGATASPLIVDGLVLFTVGLLGGGSLVALDLRTGEQAWSVPIEFQSFGSTPAVADGVAYLAGLQGDVAAIDLETREIRWQARLDAGTTSSPMVVDGVLYIGAEDDHLYALDIADGAERWRFRTGDGADYTLGPSPAYADGAVWFASAASDGDGRIYALDAATGDERWHAEPDDPGLFTPAIAGGLLFVGGEAGDLYAFDAATGDERWKAEVGRMWSTPAVTDAAVCVQTMDGALVCLDRASGEERWRADSGASWCSPVVAGEVVAVGNGGMWFEQGVHAFDIATGEKRWYMRVASVTGAVAVSGNVMVVADDEGAVCAIVGSEGDAVARGTDGNGAFLTRLVFSTDVDDDSVPIDPAGHFESGTPRLVVSFDHVGIKYQALLEVDWTLDGESLYLYSASWEGRTARSWVNIAANEGALPDGRYGVEIRLDGVPVRRGEVTIG